MSLVRAPSGLTALLVDPFVSNLSFVFNQQRKVPT